MTRSKKPVLMLDHGKSKWEHKCLADVFIPMHVGPVTLFREKVVPSALIALDNEIAGFTKSTDVSEVYRQNEIRQLRQTTVQSFCLSIHAVFERSLRSWISDSIHQVPDDKSRVVIDLYLFFKAADEAVEEPMTVEVASKKIKAKVRKDNLWKLREFVQRFRGVVINDLPSYRVLALMETVANACRHGDGDAVAKLFVDWPEFWPEQLRNLTLQRKGTLGFSSIVLPDALLYEFCAAIVAFWNDLYLVHMSSFGDVETMVSNDRREAAVLLKKSHEYTERLKQNPLFNGSLS